MFLSLICWVFTLFILVVLPVILIAIQPDLGSAIVFFSFLLVVYRAGFSEVLLLIAIIFIALFFLTLVVDRLYILAGLIAIASLALLFVGRKIKYVFGAFVILAVITSIIYSVIRFFDLELNYYFILVASLLLSFPVYMIFAVRKKIRNTLIIIGCLFVSMLFSFSVDYFYHDVLKEH